MPLPLNDSGSWPPAEHAARMGQIREARVWYGGSREKLASYYGGGTTATTNIATSVNPTGATRVQRALNSVGLGKFWSTTVPEGGTDMRRHLPTALDIAIINSELLHADTPSVRVLGPTYPSDGPEVTDPATGVVTPAHVKGDPMPETVKAQERLDAILDACNFGALLLQSSEISSPLGSAPLRIAFDKAHMSAPRLVRVDPEHTVPHYVWGSLEGVTFWRTVRAAWAGSTTVLRHLELHEGGRIYHALYQGTGDELGKRIPMTDGDATCQAIAPNLDAESALKVRFEHLGKPVKTATSIPNVLPDPLDIENLTGRSDYTPAVLDLLDAADRAYSQLMENLEDAKGRILISRSMLESAGVGKGLTFDGSQRVFTKLNTPPAEKEGGALPIEKVQFELRADEYLMLIDALVGKAIKAAGFNPETDTNNDGRDVTATEVTSRGKRSMSTRDKKLRYWIPELEALLYALLVIDAQEFGSGITPFPVQVSYPESVQPTILELANTADALNRAKAASLEVRVALVHPDWDDTQVKLEADKIRNEGRVIDPALIGLSGRLPGDAAAPIAAAPAAASTPE